MFWFWTGTRLAVAYQNEVGVWVDQTAVLSPLLRVASCQSLLRMWLVVYCCCIAVTVLGGDTDCSCFDAGFFPIMFYFNKVSKTGLAGYCRQGWQAEFYTICWQLVQAFRHLERSTVISLRLISWFSRFLYVKQFSLWVCWFGFGDPNIHCKLEKIYWTSCGFRCICYHGISDGWESCSTESYSGLECCKSSVLTGKFDCRAGGDIIKSSTNTSTEDATCVCSECITLHNGTHKVC